MGDLEEMLLEEEEEELERAGSTGAGDCCCADSLEFDGANSDTVEGSSSGHEKCETVFIFFTDEWVLFFIGLQVQGRLQSTRNAVLLLLLI